MKATENLRAEHGAILRMLDCLEKIARDSKLHGSLDLASASEALDFLTTFADVCHHGKEENVFFPALSKRGLPVQFGPIAVMLADHREGRELRARMARAVEDARRTEPKAIDEFAIAAGMYVGLMRDHIDKENGVLFPMGDEMLSPDDQGAVERAFERIEQLDMGEGVYGRQLALVDSMCTRLGVERSVPAASRVGGCCGHKTSCGG